MNIECVISKEWQMKDATQILYYMEEFEMQHKFWDELVKYKRKLNHSNILASIISEFFE